METTVAMQIDGREVTATAGSSLLQAARAAGIEIPTLCHSDELRPAGACRMCLVEITRGARTKLVAACVHPVEPGLRVVTSTPRLTRLRKLIVELLWPSAGALAHKLGVERSRFEPELTDCSLCGLCVRYCAEVAKKNVVYFQGRGVDRRIAFVPELADECDSCRGCFKLCTGGFVITEHGRAALEHTG